MSTIAQRIFGKVADRLKAPEFRDACVRRPEDFFATSEVGSARRRRDDLKSDRPYDSGRGAKICKTASSQRRASDQTSLFAFRKRVINSSPKPLPILPIRSLTPFMPRVSIGQ